MEMLQLFCGDFFSDSILKELCNILTDTIFVVKCLKCIASIYSRLTTENWCFKLSIILYKNTMFEFSSGFLDSEISSIWIASFKPFFCKLPATKLCVTIFLTWRQHPTKHQLYGPLPPIRKTIQVKRTRHAGHWWRSRDELISDVLLRTPKYGRAKAGRPAWTYIQQLCEDTGCSPEDLPEAMNDKEKWRERVKDIRGSGTTWWRWIIIDSFPLPHAY